MSLVVCDITPEEIVFMADSAHPTENLQPKDWPNDAKKVFLTPDKRIGIGIAGSLPFPWAESCSQPEGWIENVLQTESVDELCSPSKVAGVLKRKIEALPALPITECGVIMVAGYDAGAPEIHELWVKSKNENHTILDILEVHVRRPNANLLCHGIASSWDEVLTRSGRIGKSFPPRGKKRRRFLKRILESAIQSFRTEINFYVAHPVVAVRVPASPSKTA
jgi:hypothetical protein